MIRETILVLLILQSGSNSGMSTVDLREALNGTVYEVEEVNVHDDDDYDDDDVDVEMILIILVYGVTFLLGSIGNTLVIIGIAKFKKMHSVTNIFLVSLASADLLLILTCIPFKVGKTLSYVWTLGEFICKFGHYAQNLSVICSVLTLTVISVERYYAILKPMQSRFTCTKSRAKKMVLAIWAISVLFATPILIGQVHIAVGPQKNFYWCKKEWSERIYSQLYEIFMLLLVVLIPLSVIIFAYSSICRELWNVLSTRSSMTAMSQLGSQNSERVRMEREKLESSLEQASGDTIVVVKSNRIPGRKKINQESNDDIRTKKQVIKMLVMIVILFAICWVPVTVENLLRAFDLAEDLSTGWRKHLRQTFDLMSYFNSCVNPIVYAFMSKNFRQSFRSTICCYFCQRSRRRANGIGNISFHSRGKPSVSPYATRQPVRLQDSTCFQGASLETMVVNAPSSIVLNSR